MFNGYNDQFQVNKKHKAETKVHVYTQSLYNRRLSEKQGKTNNCQSLNITHMHEFRSPPLQVSGEWVAVERSSLYKSQLQCT